MSGKVSAVELLAYVLAFVAGVAVIYLVVTLSAQIMLGPGIGGGGIVGGGGMAAGFILNWLSPLAGVAVFQLLFGFGTGRWRNARFWMIAPLATYAIVGLSFLLMGTGLLDLRATVILALVALFSAGIVALTLSARD